VSHFDSRASASGGKSLFDVLDWSAGTKEPSSEKMAVFCGVFAPICGMRRDWYPAAALFGTLGSLDFEVDQVCLQVNLRPAQ